MLEPDHGCLCIVDILQQTFLNSTYHTLIINTDKVDVPDEINKTKNSTLKLTLFVSYFHKFINENNSNIHEKRSRKQFEYLIILEFASLVVCVRFRH